MLSKAGSSMAMQLMPSFLIRRDLKGVIMSEVWFCVLSMRKSERYFFLLLRMLANFEVMIPCNIS